MEGYIGNIEAETLANSDYRRVLYTGPDSQLVVMTLEPGVEIGMESHHLDQFLRIEAGQGEVTVGTRVEKVSDGFGVVVPSGTMHNVKNIGSEVLKLYTLYTAPNHKPGTVQHTKADADAAEAAEHH